MKSTYKVDKLKNYIEQIRGISYKADNILDEYKSGYKVVLRANSIKNNKLELNNLLYVDENLIKEKQIIKANDILIAASSGSKEVVGKSFQILKDTNYTFGAFCKLIRCKNNINPRYVGYFFRTEYYRNTISNVVCGANINNLKNENIDDLNIPIPRLEIQNKIVEILDKSQELIDNRKEQIEKLDLLVKSKFIEMFGDPFNDEKGYGIKKLGEVTEVNPKKSEIKELDKDLIVSFVPMDRVSEKGEFAPEVLKPISELYSGFTYFKDNDVLFAKITPCMENGKGAIAINLSNGIGFGSTEFHVLRPIKDNSNPYWVYHLTTLIEFRRLAERKMTGSAGQKRVPTDFLNNVEVVIPPIELQNQFADFVNQVDKLKFKMENSLKELEDNFNSLMQKAFKGELFN
ncbi:restriction endonuclease subunit S [Clostridium perfringens]|uniref:restriction endonuclease subunit S n=1 Tax=Clostridium perfringens TaxID=1502 RepID=UPI001ABB2B89|nr:restriction endonuclease subunit S [Clostridium perfringens]MBO3404889.1 restriction endonuclease subunit S [Clostridium perfringens]